MIIDFKIPFTNKILVTNFKIASDKLWRDKSWYSVSNKGEKRTQYFSICKLTRGSNSILEIVVGPFLMVFGVA